jgi:hypothetical protein
MILAGPRKSKDLKKHNGVTKTQPHSVTKYGPSKKDPPPVRLAGFDEEGVDENSVPPSVLLLRVSSAVMACSVADAMSPTTNK